ncbi:MAG: 4-hydroxybenzoate octaprenyltransferase, partial [Pseudomonadota bacterium]
IRIWPKPWQPYALVMRLDRPIGIWLLFIPCLWGLSLGSGEGATRWGQVLLLAGAFALGAVMMRGAGCIWNDLTDRDLDRKVRRTASRPIASGKISPRAAWLAILCLVVPSFVLVLAMGSFALIFSLAALALIVIYPFCKRISWWPQAWLGMTFNWGILLGFAAQAQSWPSIGVWLVWGGAICWTIAYDTIYAHMDRQDDMLAGIKSTAILFGDKTRVAIGLFFAFALILWCGAAILLDLSGWSYGFFALAGCHAIWQCTKLAIHNPERCLSLFKANRDFGLLVTLAFAAGRFV